MSDNQPVETTINKGKWIGVKPNKVNNSEVYSRYVENAPPSKSWTDNTNPPTTLAQSNKEKEPTDTIQSESS